VGGAIGERLRHHGSGHLGELCLADGATRSEWSELDRDPECFGGRDRSSHVGAWVALVEGLDGEFEQQHAERVATLAANGVSPRFSGCPSHHPIGQHPEAFRAGAPAKSEVSHGHDGAIAQLEGAGEMDSVGTAQCMSGGEFRRSAGDVFGEFHHLEAVTNDAPLGDRDPPLSTHDDAVGTVLALVGRFAAVGDDHLRPMTNFLQLRARWARRSVMETSTSRKYILLPLSCTEFSGCP